MTFIIIVGILLLVYTSFIGFIAFRSKDRLSDSFDQSTKDDEFK